MLQEKKSLTIFSQKWVLLVCKAVALAHLLTATCFCDMPWKFFVYTWIIIFQWIAMWQHHSLL
jgi:hypothetical protein